MTNAHPTRSRITPEPASGADTRSRFAGFSLVELLVVIGVLAVLAAILLPALAAIRNASDRTLATSNLKQIHEWMTLYGGENKGYIVPSQFDYSSINPPAYRGKVRSIDNDDPDTQHMGTWTDILWTLYAGSEFTDSVTGEQYLYDSPDQQFYDTYQNFLDDNVLRSPELNTKGPLKTYPGFFAANNFFDANENNPTFNGWHTHPQIVNPARSVYAIDSWWGEFIEDDPVDWDFDAGTSKVDFRYDDQAMILLMDGNVVGRDRESAETLDQLEMMGEPRIKVRELDQR